ncbi:MAG: alpha-glucosidase C-terminal domain-containing protein [Sphingobacteriales bacterium]|nr:alpha-glucosidase C-terminal domain-containing protein [Sphingobacteriales bacterium]
MKKLILLLLLPAFLFSCKSKTPKTEIPAIPVSAGHPGWITQGNIYEVNTRQYTPQGTFTAFAAHLDRLKEMGVQTVWFMPINPISKKDRKGPLGSYYAVSDYTGINPEYGNMDDWKQLVKTIHDKGMKVLIDWVPNHTGADHPWLISHPDFFVKDSTGKAATMFDWTDTRVLDYKNNEMQDSMIAAMKFWITQTGIDGYRVDVAWNVPAEFWKKCIPQLKAANKDLFFLAEGDKPYLLTSGFDAYYPWDMFHMMVSVAAGTRPAFALDSVKAKYDSIYPKEAIPLYFTSNHDENSWNKSDYKTFPGPVHAPFAVFTQTMGGTVPLVYSGQEEPLLRPLPFFKKDSIRFGKFERAKFYKTLLELRSRNEALSVDASFRKIAAGDTKAVYAFVREKAGKKILVILNLSKKEQTIKITDKDLLGNPYNVFMGNKEAVADQEWKLEPWGYVVYEYDTTAGK